MKYWLIEVRDQKNPEVKYAWERVAKSAWSSNQDFVAMTVAGLMNRLRERAKDEVKVSVTICETN